MEMILVDWTRMGKTFCVAGVVADGQAWRTVRPLPTGNLPRAPTGLAGMVQALTARPTSPDAPPRNVGWFAEQLARLRRWDVIELVEPRPAEIERPHTEDVWVRLLRSTGRSVEPADRPAILRATCVQGFAAHFGLPLVNTRVSAYLRPGLGERSLVTVLVPARDASFQASQREGADAAEVRVEVRVPRVGAKLLPVKDHHLLCQAERAAPGDLDKQVEALQRAIAAMGATVAIRLGLSRGFDSGRGEKRCWLMADGFFPAQDVQR